MQNLTATSNKDELISAAVELTDMQASQIENLKAERKTLAVIALIAVTWVFVF